MNKEERIPLEERLRKLESESPQFLKAFDFYIDEYYDALMAISGNENVQKKYQGRGKEYFQHLYSAYFECLEEDYMCCYIFELNYKSDNQKMHRLYHLLIEPFVIIKDFERSERNYE